MKRLAALLLVVLLPFCACGEGFVPEYFSCEAPQPLGKGPAAVTLAAQTVSPTLLQVTICPVDFPQDAPVPRVFVMYAMGEAVGMAYPDEAGVWLGFVPWIGDTLILVPVYGDVEEPDQVLFLTVI